MKIIVTGAAGFIGSHMAERLSDLGHDVLGVDCFSDYYSVELKKQNAAELSKMGISVLDLDLRDQTVYRDLPDDVDMIYHFAAHPGNSADSSFEDYFSNNVFATRLLIEYCEDHDWRPYFVNISTSSVYGLEAVCPETTAAAPVSWYGISKLAAEQLVMSKIRTGYLRGTSVRLYSVYGPRERPDKLYSILISCGLNGGEFPLFKGSDLHLRSFTYVADSVEGLSRISELQDVCNGEIYNLGSEMEYSTEEGIRTVEEILGVEIKKRILPARPGDQLRTKALIDKARKDLNYHPSTSLKNGLEAQVEWFRKMKNKKHSSKTKNSFIL